MMNRSERIKTILQEYGLLIFVIAFAVGLTLMSDRFLTVNNLINVLRQATINGIMAVGMTMVIILAKAMNLMLLPPWLSVERIWPAAKARCWEHCWEC